MRIEILGAIVALWIVGGQIKGSIRDVGVPLLLGFGIWLDLSGDWMHRIIYAVLLVGTYQIIRLGYGNYSPEDDDKPSFLAAITHDRQGYVIRAVWGLLVGLVGTLPLLLGRYIPFSAYALYGLVNALIGYMVSKFKFGVWLTDSLVSLGVGSILFLVNIG